MSISQLCISVPLSTSCTDFTVNSKFSANRGSYLQCFSWLKHWTKRFCADFSRSVANRMQVVTNKIHQNTLINGMRLFLPENWTDFFFHELPKEMQSKIVYIYSVIDEYSLRSRDVHSTPSWPNWSDFEYRLWCLAIVVRTPPARHRKCERFRRIVLFKFFDFYFKNRDLTNLLFGRGPNRVLEMACFDPKVQ